MSMKKTIGRVADAALLIFAGICSAFSVAPTITGIRHEGVIIGLVMSLLLWFWWIVLQRGGRRLKIVISVLGCVAILCLVALLMPMFISAYGNPPPEDPGVILVPGAQIRDGQPSLMLKNRLDVAYELWQKSPQSHVVVSGGYGDGMVQSEAEVMKAYLVGLGVTPELILTEDASRNTEQNMMFSAELLRENGISLENGLTITTDGFHQHRCKMWAEVAGFTHVYADSCATPIGLMPTYWLRDMMGIPHFYLIERPYM